MSNWRTGLCVLMIPLFMALSATNASAAATYEGQSGRRSVATVIFSGLGGGVVGLSTLSFYGSPQDHTGNIYTGLVLGLLAGVAYVMTDPTSNSFERAQIQNQPVRGLSDFKNLFLQPPVQNTIYEVAAYRWDF